MYSHLESARSRVSDAGHRWLTALGGFEKNRAVLNISVASGGIFDTATAIDYADGGTITLTFDSCSAGVVEFDIPSIDQTGSMPIQRVANDDIAVCEALKEP